MSCLTYILTKSHANVNKFRKNRIACRDSSAQDFALRCEVREKAWLDACDRKPKAELLPPV